MSVENKTETVANNNAVDRMIQPIREAGEALKQAGQRAGEHNKAINLRLTDFAERNTADTLAAFRSAVSAKSASEFFTVQSNFLRDQAARGVDQFREIAGMVSTASRDAANLITERASVTK